MVDESAIALCGDIAKGLGLALTVDRAARKIYLGHGLENHVASEVVDTALGWVEHDYEAGVVGMCASFVRHVFAQAGHPLGITAHPFDEPTCRQYGVSPLTGVDIANSLSGADIGRVWPGGQRAPQAGDLVFFAGTYEPAGVDPAAVPTLITHVGICVGEGEMVDRGTSDAPVTRRSIAGTFGVPACVIRPACYGRS